MPRARAAGSSPGYRPASCGTGRCRPRLLPTTDRAPGRRAQQRVAPQRARASAQKADRASSWSRRTAIQAADTADAGRAPAAAATLLLKEGLAKEGLQRDLALSLSSSQ